MAVLNNDFSKFKALITINDNNVNPGVFDASSDSSRYQARLNNDRSASRELGMDFLMFAKGGLFRNDGDFKKASGIFNFAQALTHRLMTDRGTMPGDQFFGVPWSSYLGKTYKNPSLILANLRNDISEEVFKDRRTSEILSLTTEFTSPTIIEVSITVLPIFSSIEGAESLTIDLTGGL